MDTSIYNKAANNILEFQAKNNVRFYTPTNEIERLLTEFRAKFAPDKLKDLPDDKLLNTIFLTADGGNDSLCYHLEYNPGIKKSFGSISGGSSYKYGLFQRQEDGKWITGASKNSKELNEDEALILGRKIRDYLVNGCELISSRELNSVEDYEALDDELNAMMGNYASYAWIQKYFYLIFQDRFVGWYIDEWLNHILFGLNIVPSEKYYGKNGQLSIICRMTGLSAPHFQDVCYSMFGEIKHFYRLGSSDSDNHYADSWITEGIVAIGWPKLGDLTKYLSNGSLNKERITEALTQNYYQTDKRTASRKAAEIKAFYEATGNSVFVVMDGEQLLGFVDGLSPYYYDPNASMPHRRGGVWKIPFSKSDRLPEQEGMLTTCYEFRKNSNLIYLYSKYYEQTDTDADGQSPIVLQTDYERSRITSGINVLLYGVPGSGKSWTIEHEYVKPTSKVERLVFHPDYTYSDFVGQILPCVDDEGQVSYKFTPGPFTNILRDAYLHPQDEYILVIEEINRGNAPAIFGEIFQLLDRKVDEEGSNNSYPVGTSEYGITNANIAQIVYGDPTHKVRIPSNLSIIATMNTSDQNVFTLDTAFQRRWQMRLIENSFENVDPSFANMPILDTTVTWETFCTEINKIIIGNGVRTTSSEDKRLGAYFIHKRDLAFDSNMGDLKDGTYDELRKKESAQTITDEEKTQLATIRSAMMQNRRFPEKVIKYLWDDAFKFNREAVFDVGAYQSLEDVIRAFLYSSGRDRMNIFSESVRGAIFNTEA